MFFVILSLIIISVIFWYKKKYARHNLLLSKIPCLKIYPIIYHCPYFFNQNPSSFFYYIEELNKKLGDVYYICLGNVMNAFSVVADVKIVEELLTSNVEFDKTSDYELLVPWIGKGLLISSDKKWFQRRKLLTPGFHFQILEKFIKVMNDTAKIFADKLETFGGREIDIFPLVNMFALDTVCECTMAKKLNSQTEDSAYARAVKEITNIVMIRSFDPIKGIDFFYKFTKMYRREKELIEIFHAFTNKIIDSRREELLKMGSENITELAESKKKALLDILLTSTIDGSPLTNEDIREEVDTFLFAGHDTTTSALSFIFFNIAKYPEVQEKIYDEINEIFGNDEEINLSQLNILRYTELVIKESLRLFPSVPYYGRKLKNEFTAGGFTFPASMSILISSYLMGRSEKYFENPEIFNPERFDVETTYEKINPFAYVPFSAGPRNCIGQKFASLVLRSAIVRVIQKFKLSLGETCEDPPLLSIEIVLRPANGIYVKFEKR